MKHLYVPLLLFFFCMNCQITNAQQLISTAGDDTSGSAWAVGEVIGGYCQAREFSIFQGILANEEFVLPVGFGTDERDDRIMTWPNPVTDYINIRISEYDLPVIACIYSLSGVLVTRLVLHTAQAAFPLSSLNSGMYYIKLTDIDNKQLETKKIIKL